MNLSPTMREALREVEREPGQLAARLPGGERTIEALMRRGKVEVAGREWRTYLPDPNHVHTFQPGMHMDGCHFFANSGQCECGAQVSTMHERDLRNDVWSLEWMSSDCDRCRQLRNGARPKSSVIISRRGDA